jgi:hypothetical protein
VASTALGYIGLSAKDWQAIDLTAGGLIEIDVIRGLIHAMADMQGLASLRVDAGTEYKD